MNTTTNYRRGAARRTDRVHQIMDGVLLVATSAGAAYILYLFYHLF